MYLLWSFCKQCVESWKSEIKVEVVVSNKQEYRSLEEGLSIPLLKHDVRGTAGSHKVSTSAVGMRNVGV